MDSYPFVFTILFMLLGPLKVIGPFASVTREVDNAFVRSVAISATLASAAVLAFIAFAAGGNAGEVPSLAAFPEDSRRPGPADRGAAHDVRRERRARRGQAQPARALTVAVSPVTIPIIVPPAGVAAMLILAAVAPELPGVTKVMAVSLRDHRGPQLPRHVLQSRHRQLGPADAGAAAHWCGPGVHSGRAGRRHDADGIAGTWGCSRPASRFEVDRPQDTAEDRRLYQAVSGHEGFRIPPQELRSRPTRRAWAMSTSPGRRSCCATASSGSRRNRQSSTRRTGARCC